MEGGRRRGPSGSSNNVLIRAVAVGMVCGLIISGAMIYHRMKLQTLQLELARSLAFHEETLDEERHKRELAEQLQGEADTERTRIQNQLSDLSGTVIEETEAAKKATAAAQKAEEARVKAANELSNVKQQLREAQTKLGKLTAQDQALREAQKDGRHVPMKPSEELDTADPELAAALRKVARRDEVLVAISNRNYAQPGGMLDGWMRTVKGAGVTNAMVVALDEDTKSHAESNGFLSLIMDLKIPESQRNVGSNHAVSGLKFRILQRFLKLGYAVLLSDVDIIYLQNPFQHLFRDSDVEAMSDGWNNNTAYGYDDVDDDPSMGWARYAHSMRIFCFNSGLFYIRPTEASLMLLEKIVHRIESEAGWDQAIFNEVIFFPSHNEKNEPAITRRVMDYYKFMNSKVLFKEVRHNPALRNQRPVTFHANYHSNKAERLEAAESFWLKGDDMLLMRLQEGS